MKLRASGSFASGTHGVPSDFCHEWARLKACPISCTAVQKRIRSIHAAGFGSFVGGCEMNESTNRAVPCRWFGPMSSNMIPPRPEPASCMDAKKIHIAHCALLAKRDQWICIASCISMSDHVVPGGAATELEGFVVTWQPTRRNTVGMVRFSHGSEAGRTGWAHVCIAVSATSPASKSNSRFTVRKYGDENL